MSTLTMYLILNLVILINIFDKMVLKTMLNNDISFTGFTNHGNKKSTVVNLCESGSTNLAFTMKYNTRYNNQYINS